MSSEKNPCDSRDETDGNDDKKRIELLVESNIAKDKKIGELQDDILALKKHTCS